MNRLVAITLLALTACADLDPATLITRDRVLAARVTVDGQPDRAWPAPREQATVTWVTASPGTTPTFSWVLSACPAATSTGMPACAGAVFASSEDTGPIPTLALAIPADIATPSVTVAGAICASGTPILDGETSLATCSDGTRADVVSQHVFLATDQTNHNPVLATAPIGFGDEEWADGADCEALPSVAANGDKARIRVTFTAADREPFVGVTGPTREALQLAVFSTAGDVLQQHSYIEADDERDESTIVVEWDAPEHDERPADGRVKFTFVVRDMRGGVDATTRELCIR